MVIGEEIESLSRTRGENDGNSGIHDRIMTTLLQRLDPTVNKKLQDRLILFFFTSNVPQLVDPAFLRRAGGTVERFHRLDESGFRAVLSKHVSDVPINIGGKKYATGDKNIETAFCDGISNWMYADDKPLVKLIFGNGTSESKYRKDFLTGALIDRAIQQSSDTACRRHRSEEIPGITVEDVIESLNTQIRSIVDQLHNNNVYNYLDLPDHIRVGGVQKL
jgi:SpoVK/Ycf46/Vps4 family AAA+-type ATPase